MSFGERVAAYQQRLQQGFEHWLPPATQLPARLHEAMRYSSAGGKRIRPMIIYATGETLGAPAPLLDSAAIAVEMIHVYSLIHDDLPAMDDDDLRRGRPTCHKQFDEATAILAGDALQALAFHVLAHDSGSGLEPMPRLKMIDLLAEACGSRGMAGGQQMDLDATGKSLGIAELEALHIHKTGALIRASVLMACHSHTPLPVARIEALDRYGKCLGLAFQIQDDILDVEGDGRRLGKTTGKDHRQNKSTYPSVLGMAVAKSRARDLFEQAHAAIAIFGESAEPLQWIAHHIERRDR